MRDKRETVASLIIWGGSLYFAIHMLVAIVR